MTCAAAPASWAQLSSYSQDFESLDPNNLMALENAGWLVFGNVFDPGGGYLYGYGVFPAPNNPGSPAFSLVAGGQGGPPQGAQQLVVFSDYNNGDHANGFLIESNVFQEQIIGAADVGSTWTFKFDAKLGDLMSPTTASAWFKTLDPANGFALTNFPQIDTTTTPTTWTSYSISIFIDASLAGQILQFGFLNTATNFTPSGIFYDNVEFVEAGATNYCTTGTTGALMDLAPGATVSIATNNFAVQASPVTNTPGIFYYGQNQVSSGPFGEGTRCVGAGPLGTFRLQPPNAPGGATAMRAIPFDSAPGNVILAGSCWNFQYWFRRGDLPGLFDLSDGLSVVFAP